MHPYATPVHFGLFVSLVCFNSCGGCNWVRRLANQVTPMPIKSIKTSPVRAHFNVLAVFSISTDLLDGSATAAAVASPAGIRVSLQALQIGGAALLAV